MQMRQLIIETPLIRIYYLTGFINSVVDEQWYNTVDHHSGVKHDMLEKKRAEIYWEKTLYSKYCFFL